MESKAPAAAIVAGIVLLAGVGYAIWSAPWLVLGAALVVFVGGGLVAKRMLGSSSTVQALRNREAELERQRARRDAMAGLKKTLHSIRKPEVADEAEKALAQIASLLDLFARAEHSVNEKFSPGEITYGRYLGIVQQVFDGTVRKLTGLVRLLETRESMRRSGDEVDGAEERSHEILAEVDRALVSLAELDEQLDAVQAKDAPTSASLEATIGELDRLAERAHLYSNEPAAAKIAKPVSVPRRG